jgi:hypothetical protein
MQTNKSNQGKGHADHNMKNDPKRADEKMKPNKASRQDKNDDDMNDSYMEDNDTEQEEVETNPKKREHTIKADNKNAKPGQVNSGSKKQAGAH